MRLVKGISSTLAVVTLVAAGHAAAQQQRKPNIVILATGGTIAGAGGWSFGNQSTAFARSSISFVV